MALPDSYTQKPAAIPDYFDAILTAQAPDRFSTRFLEKLGFKSTNDRLFISILKELGFLDADGVPTDRYYQFHDRTQWRKVLAVGIREAYADLYAVNQSAHEMDADEVGNKLRTLYAGSKNDRQIKSIARTFTALCEIADFSDEFPTQSEPAETEQESAEQNGKSDGQPLPRIMRTSRVSLDSLQYHINIILPDTRDQAVFDAIFKSLRDHLG